MNYKIHNNGWTVFMDLDIKKCNQDDISIITKFIANNTCVIIKNQLLTVDDELKFLNMFKDPLPLYSKDNPFFKDYVSDIEKDPEGVICRVTGELRDGKPGMADWEDGFDWHCNNPEESDRRPIIYLYGVRGTQGSRTSWNNNMLAYSELSDEIKNKIAKLHCIYGNFSAPDAPDHCGVEYNTEWTPSLVHTTLTGESSMYFSPLQLGKFVELDQEESDNLKNLLMTHIFQEKYIYHHDWEDGDIVLSDQWNGIHKRWAFQQMDSRLLHRAAVDYIDQNYNNKE